MASILGYWDVRALVEPIYLVLAQAGEEYKLRSYKHGPAPDFERSDWLNENFTLGLDFPNIPYYIDGDVKITQTLAIIRYLARKYDLGPKSEAEIIRSEMAEQAAMEMMNKFIQAVYVKRDMWEASKGMLLDFLPSKLEQMAQFIGDREFILGDRVTYVDFLLYSFLDYLRLLQGSLFYNLQSLEDYLARIEALPAIEKYIKSESYKRFPITGPMAIFGGYTV